MALAGAFASGAGAEQSASNGSIVFRRYLDADQTTGAVFTITADGQGERQITTPPAGTVDDQPEWSPDGSLIAFTRCAQGAPCHVFTVAPDGTGLTLVCPAGTTCPDDEFASFSVDSQRLVFVQSTGRERGDAYTEKWIEHSAIAVMKRDGSDRRVIFQGPPFSGDLLYPIFSPGGKQIVFERVASAFTRRSGQRAVFVVRADGSHLRRLTPWEEGDGDNPDWSPDGKWIVFHSHVDEDDKKSQIFLIHPDGSGRRQVTHFPKGTRIGSSSFSPDGTSLVISKGPADGNLQVFTIRLDGTKLRRVTQSATWDSAPAWGPRI
jgi:Tol biopolymer transport system component